MRIDLLDPSFKTCLRLETCPLLRHLSQPDQNIPKGKHNSRLPGVSWLKHRSRVNTTSNFRPFETKVLRWIRRVEGMIEAAVSTSVACWRNQIQEEAVYSTNIAP